MTKHITEANALAERGDIDAAVREFKAAAALDPARLGAWQGLGILYTSQGKWLEAIDAFERVTKLRPSEGADRFNLALAYLRANTRYDEAVRQYDMAVKFGLPSNPEFEKVLQPYRNQEREFKYRSRLATTPTETTIRLTGNAHAGKDDVLIEDILGNLEVAAHVKDHGMFHTASSTIVSTQPTSSTEQWTVIGEGYEQVVPMQLVTSPTGGTDILMTLEPQGGNGAHAEVQP